MPNLLDGDISAWSYVPLDAAKGSFDSIEDTSLSAQLAQVIGLQKTMLDMMLADKDKAEADKEKAEYNSFGKRMERAMGYMHGKFEDLSSSLGTGVDNLKKLFGSFLEKMQDIGAAISKKAKELGGDIKDKAVEFKNFVKGKLGDLAEHMQTFYKDTMKPALEKAGGEARKAFNTAVEKIKPHMENAADRVAIVYHGTKERMGSVARKAGEMLIKAGASVEDSSQLRKTVRKAKQQGRGKGGRDGYTPI